MELAADGLRSRNQNDLIVLAQEDVSHKWNQISWCFSIQFHKISEEKKQQNHIESQFILTKIIVCGSKWGPYFENVLKGCLPQLIF